MVQLTALAVNPSTFDPVRSTLAGASLLGSQIQNATALQDLRTAPERTALALENARRQNAMLALQTQAAQRSHGALADFGAQGGFGNPSALQALSRDPQLFSGALSGYSAYQTWQNAQTAQGAQRVLAAGPEGSEARTRAYREELGRALAERRIDQNRYTQMIAQDPSDTALQRLIDLARPLTAEPSINDIMRMSVPGGGGQLPPGGPRPPAPVDMGMSALGFDARDRFGLNVTPESVGGPPPIALPPQGGPPGGPRVYGWMGTAEAQTPPPGRGGGLPPAVSRFAQSATVGTAGTPEAFLSALRDPSTRALWRQQAATDPNFTPAERSEILAFIDAVPAREAPPVAPSSGPQGPLGGDLNASIAAGRGFQGAPGFDLRWSPDAFAPQPAAGAGVQGGPPGVGAGGDINASMSPPPFTPRQGFGPLGLPRMTPVPPGAPQPETAPTPLSAPAGITLGMEMATADIPSVALNALNGGAQPPPPSGPENVGQVVTRVLGGATAAQRVRFWMLMSRGSTRDDAMKLLQEIEIGGAERTAAETARGKALGEAQAGLPQAVQSGSSMIDNIDRIITDPNLGWITGRQSDWSTGSAFNPLTHIADIPTYLSNIPNIGSGPSLNTTRERIAQVQGQAFLQAFQSLRGGGQISEQEGAKAQAAMTRLGNLAQDDAGYMQALFEARREIWNLTNLARTRAGMQPVPYQPHAAESQGQSPPSTLPPILPPGTRLKYNPQTGQLE